MPDSPPITKALQHKVTLHESPAPSDLAQTVAADLTAAVQAGTVRTLALSGGRIALALFDALTHRAQPNAEPWHQLHIFWADERCVPPSHPDSNFREAHQRFLQPLGLPEGRIHRIQGELEPTTAADRAETELQSVTNSLDLVLLGMGEDGHIASLFPGFSPDHLHSTRLYIPVTGPKPPPNRITLTYQALASANQVWVLVAGPGKARALHHSLQVDSSLPMGRLLQLRPQTRILFTSENRPRNFL